MRATGVTAVLSLLDGNQNLAAYAASGLEARHAPLPELEADLVQPVYEAMTEVLSDPAAVLLVHRDIVDDRLAGVLAGFLVYSGRVDDPIVAVALIQEILGRPLGPEARAIIPAEA